MAYLPYSDQVIISSQGAKVGSNSVISVGTAASVGNPPLPLAVIYSDSTGTLQANPFFADANGLFTFYAASGVYRISVNFGTAIYIYPVTLGTG